MDVEQRSKKLGKFTDLGSADVGGKFAFTFKLLNSDCLSLAGRYQEVRFSDREHLPEVQWSAAVKATARELSHELQINHFFVE
ncbi:hypothetical protein OSTOST_08617 [Ostertagia ostertagi]